MDSGEIISCLIDPLNITRFLAWFCAMIAFSVLSANGEFVSYGSKTFPVYNCEQSPVDFVVIIGIFSWLIAAFYLAVAFGNKVSSQFRSHRKTIELSEFVCASLLGFLWFVAFCWTANKWGSGDDCCYPSSTSCYATFKQIVDLAKDDADQTMAIQAAEAGIAFSFFSWLLWMAITGLLARKMFFGGNTAEDDDSAYKGAADPEPTDGGAYDEFQNEYTQYDDADQ
eukprot:m.20658 g.20658  ORF g.20658 m.20658 type:complete len:226 (-) comp13042_c0_seq1:485-1162(-)